MRKPKVRPLAEVLSKSPGLRESPDRPPAVMASIEAEALKNIVQDDVESPELPKLPIPEDWQLGALLNVRNNGEYFVTLFPEEYDNRHPERALRFPNPAECQHFVSNWYARTWHDGMR